MSLGQPCDRAWICIDAVLDQTESRAALFVQHTDLAVQPNFLCFHMFRKVFELGILRFTAVSTPGKHGEFSVTDTAESPDSIPLDFVQPLITCGGLRYCGGQHRIETRGHGGLNRTGYLRVVEPSGTAFLFRDFVLGPP